MTDTKKPESPAEAQGPERCYICGATAPEVDRIAVVDGKKTIVTAAVHPFVLLHNAAPDAAAIAAIVDDTLLDKAGKSAALQKAMANTSARLVMSPACGPCQADPSRRPGVKGHFWPRAEAPRSLEAVDGLQLPKIPATAQVHGAGEAVGG